MDYIADTLLASADGFHMQAAALLWSVKSLYNEDTEGYNNTVAKIHTFCKKDKQEQQKLLEKQRTTLLTTDQTPEAAANKRCPRRPQATPVRGRSRAQGNRPRTGPNKQCRSNSNQRGRRSRSRSTNRRPDKDNEQELLTLLKKIAANVCHR